MQLSSRLDAVPVPKQLSDVRPVETAEPARADRATRMNEQESPPDSLVLREHWRAVSLSGRKLIAPPVLLQSKLKSLSFPLSSSVGSVRMSDELSEFPSATLLIVTAAEMQRAFRRPKRAPSSAS